MPKTVTASEAKNRLGSIIEWVLQSNDVVIVERRGEPKVAMLPIREYEEIQMIREQVRRRDALARLERLRDEVGRRNADLSPEEADRLADRFVRDVIDDMVTEGKIQFGQ
jgi:prevent-host-death family protein